MYPAESDLNYVTDDMVAFYSLPYEALNNWSAHRVSLWGKEFPTAEHAFQYAKFIDSNPAIAEKILAAPSPWKVFQVTNEYRSLAPSDWQERKISIMTEIIRAKIDQNEDVRERLLSTGQRRIIENSPRDSFWGIGKDGSGQNTLDKIFMQIRSELQTDTC